MFWSPWRPIDRFSLQHFKYTVNELQEITAVDKFNRELVVDILQSIVEIVTYGDRHDPLIFECFMEYQVLAEFVRLLKISRKSIIEAPLLQYLSIMIQNMQSDHAIYYCFSNNHINNIMAHQYEFDKGDLIQYYISFLRAVSGKINRDTLCLLLKVHGDKVVEFPLYSEALKFARHGEKMIQIAVRALTLNIYNVSDDMVYQFITTSPVSDYFSDLIQNIMEQCVHLDALISASREKGTPERRKELLMETDKMVDDFYYLKDILAVGESRLNRLITQDLLRFLVFPMLLPLMQLSQSNGLNLSALSSLCIVSRLLQVVDEEDMVNSVAGAIIYSHMFSSADVSIEADKSNCMTHNNPSVHHLCAEEEMLGSCRAEGAKTIYMNSNSRQFSEYMSSISCTANFPLDSNHGERNGILSYAVSEDHGLLLASLHLVIILAENSDFDSMLTSMLGSWQSESFNQKIINRLLKILASEPPFSILIQWHTGWFLRKLLVLGEKKLSSHEFHLFNISFERSLKCLQKEIDGSWFDHIPDTFRNEWGSCKSALEQSSKSKDPFFIPELNFYQEVTEGPMSSYLAWRKMVDAVKVFVLHLQLKGFVLKGGPVEVGNPLINLRSNILSISGKNNSSDISFASFGSELPLDCAVPCKIALTKVGTKDVYVLPMARGISGKLLLMEQHPLHKQHGVVFTVAPLAGLSPKIDENHGTWLHLQIREFDPKKLTDKSKIYESKKSNHFTEGRWTLGFSDTETCEAVRLFVVEEINKQRSCVEKLLAPLLQDNFAQDLTDSKS